MKKGIVIDSIAATVIVIISAVIVVNILSNTFEESKAYGNLNKAKETMTFLDTVIRELAVEAPGARRAINVVSDFGSFTVDGSGDRIKFFMESPAAILDPGSAIKEGNIETIAGPTMQAYEKDVDNDGITDLVLENGAVLFAVRKVGSPTNITTVNTTNMITVITNKRASVNITPITSIYIDDDLANSFGNGFTQLSAQGSSLSSASIKVYVNSSVKEYDAIFTLKSAQDFVELEVKNIKNK